jgi:hypothetical protein
MQPSLWFYFVEGSLQWEINMESGYIAQNRIIWKSSRRGKSIAGRKSIAEKPTEAGQTFILNRQR